MRRNVLLNILSRIQRLNFRHLHSLKRLPAIFAFVLSLFPTLGFAHEFHPQEELFGGESDRIWVGVNPTAQIRLINPLLAGENFGSFQIPSEANLILREYDEKPLLDMFAVGKQFSERKSLVFVPPETGRAVLLPPSSHPIYRDILIKGTGPVEKFTVDNQLRFAKLGFDGYFEVSESVRDLVTSEILNQAGVLVSRGVAVIDHQVFVDRKGLPEPLRMGNYVRAYRVQTRISNLEKLTPKSRKAAIDDAIQRLSQLTGKKYNYVQYFHYMTTTLAKNAAIYQAIGFTQDSLHFGQVTLAGEMTDLGIGHFDRPHQKGVVNTAYPWFRFERQPLLLQNMLYRTHSVKAEPDPIELSADSETVHHQKTLFEYIRSFDPESARQIEAINPLRMFWDSYDQFYRQFDANLFDRNVLSHYSEFFQWSPDRIISKIPKNRQLELMNRYGDLLRIAEKGLDRPGRRGPLPLSCWERKTLFHQALQDLHLESFVPAADFLQDPFEFKGHPGKYLNYSYQNPIPDLSWKPTDRENFLRNKTGVHPLSIYLKDSKDPLGVGQKIIWVTEAGLSPYAVIRSVNKDRYAISYEQPETGAIMEAVVGKSEILKFNSPEKTVVPGSLISGTELVLGKELTQRSQSLAQALQTHKPDFQKDSPSLILEKQRAALYSLVAHSVTKYFNELDEGKRAEYMRRLRARLDGKEIWPLEEAMVCGSGNCMDQNFFTNLLLSQIAETFGIRYGAYIAKDPVVGDKHFFTIVTLLPSQEQYVIESSGGGNRVFALSQIPGKNWFPIQNIIDRHGAPARARQCSKIHFGT